MRIDEIISGIEGDGPRSYYQFETFVHQLLKKHLSDQNKPYEIYNERLSLWDSIAQEGIDDINGSTAIDITFHLSRFSPQSFTDKILRTISLNENKIQIENILIISAKPISKKWLESFQEYQKSLQPRVKTFIWGPEKLNSIISKNIKITNKIYSNLFSLGLQNAMAEEVKDWREERNEIIIGLKELYKKGQFSLFLGAGVSSSAGMPDWNTLLNSLFVSYLTEEFNGDIKVDNSDIKQIADRLNKVNEPSALMAARYLKKGLSKNSGESQEFINAVTKNLYNLRDEKKDINSELIKSIATVCLPKRTGAKIKSLVTYNFDDLLERQLAQHSIQHRSIYNNTDNYDPDELPLYHVHGFLPENRNNYNALDRSTLVFSEEGYHQIYSDPYHWSNLVQLNILRENNCLMIGLSMSDPNLRRLLDISSKNIEKSKHFSFMQRLSSENFCHDHDGHGTINNIDAANKFLSRHHVLNEKIMRELGVTIIWYETYDEIHNIINQLAQ